MNLYLALYARIIDMWSQQRYREFEIKVQCCNRLYAAAKERANKSDLDHANAQLQQVLLNAVGYNVIQTQQ